MVIVPVMVMVIYQASVLHNYACVKEISVGTIFPRNPGTFLKRIIIGSAAACLKITFNVGINFELDGSSHYKSSSIYLSNLRRREKGDSR